MGIAFSGSSLSTASTFGAANWAVACQAQGVIASERSSVNAAEHQFALASVSKLLTSYAVLIAVDEGVVNLDEPLVHVGQTVTLRQLLSHASGLSSDDPLVFVNEPMTKRAYSNAGIELAAQLVQSGSGFAFDEYLRQAVLEPLAMHATDVSGSPAHGYRSTLDDLCSLARELLAPTLLSNELSQQMATVQFADLNGVLPGYGSQRPNPWGLGVEIRGDKSPHWTGTDAPAQTFGHFGQSGTYVLIDRLNALFVVYLGDRPFGPWAVDAWAPFNDAIRREIGG